MPTADQQQPQPQQQDPSAWTRLLTTATASSLPRRLYHELSRYAVDHPIHTTMAALSIGSRLVKLGHRLYDSIIWSGTVLELSLEHMSLAEEPVEPTLWERLAGGVSAEKVHYHEVVQAIEKATEDRHIVGLVLTVGSGSVVEQMQLSHLSEIRDALVRFRAAKKFTVAQADSVGEFHAALRTYWFTSACEHVMVGDKGMVTIPPMISHGIFFKNMLRKLDVDPYVEMREAHKSAGNQLTEEKFTKEHREQVVKLLEGIQGTMIRQIAESRGVTEEAVSQWVNGTGSMTPQQALDMHVIDSVGTMEEAYEYAAKRAGRALHKTPFLFALAYLRKRGKPYESGKKGIAIVYAGGPISYGETPNSALMGAGIEGSNVARFLREARKDSNVRVIILRINSPGGSAIGSDQVSREIELCQRDGKKVVVSMGVVAASGGYWISCPADVIVCERFTITGSIGVVFTKLYMRDLYANKFGITVDSFMTSDISKRFSSLFAVDDDQRKAVSDEIDHLYETFKDLVSRTRKIDSEHVSKIAGGQVYLGEEAQKLQLVDHVGGLSMAISVAKGMAGFSEKDRVQLVRFPKRKGVLAMLMDAAKTPDNREQRDKKLASIGASASVSSPLSAVASTIGIHSPIMRMFYTTFSMIAGALQLPNLGPSMNNQSSLSLRSSVDASSFR